MITEGAFKRLKANDQLNLTAEAGRFFKGALRYDDQTAKSRWHFIQRAKSEFWSFAPKVQGTAPQRDRITATEVNDWLATLPPVPLNGEAST